MKVVEITAVLSHVVTTDDKDYPIYRRNGPDNWEQMMGCSWECVLSGVEELEAAYQAHIQEAERPKSDGCTATLAHGCWPSTTHKCLLDEAAQSSFTVTLRHGEEG